MPPPLTATLLKAVVVAAPSRHHPPPAHPFLYGRRRPPPHSAPRLPPRANAPAIINSRDSIATRTRIVTLDTARGAERSAAQGWWMGAGSGHAPPAAGHGARRRAGNGKAPLRAADSVREGGDDGIGAGMNGGQGLQRGPALSSRLLTLPTMLTLGRVASVPLLVSTFYMNGQWATTATTSIFIAAAITDWLDGYIARKMRLGTAFGAFLDPVADKLMVAATLVLLCTRPLEVAMFREVPWLLTVPSIAIIGREITMSAVREWAASQNGRLLEAVAVNNLGKWKTATQMTALTILLAMRDASLTGPGFLVASGVILLYISSGLALWSLVVYMRKIWRILLK